MLCFGTAEKNGPMPAPIKVGNVTIHQVVEQEGPFFDILRFFPTLTKELLEENRAWMQPKFMSAQDQIVLCVQSYLVQTPKHNILIDTCVGNHKPRPARPFWNMMNSDRYQRGLAGTGLGVGEIDFVMCTHLHVDHVGWNTRLENGRWVPTFPNARYVFADHELAHWTQRHKDDPAACPWITDSVLPIVAANRVDIVKSTHTFNDARAIRAFLRHLHPHVHGTLSLAVEGPHCALARCVRLQGGVSVARVQSLLFSSAGARKLQPDQAACA